MLEKKTKTAPIVDMPENDHGRWIRVWLGVMFAMEYTTMPAKIASPFLRTDVIMRMALEISKN